MNSIRHDLFDLLRQTLLKSLRDDRVSRGVGNLAGLLVRAGVVEGIWDLVLDGAGDLCECVSKMTMVG